MDNFHDLRDRGRAFAARNQLDEAANALVLAAAQTHVSESDYESVLGPLVKVLTQRRDARSALTVLWYSAASSPELLRTSIDNPELPHVDRARSYGALGDYAAAAREMESAGFVAQAAIFREKMRDFAGARALWARLGQVATSGKDAYVSALIQFNIARCAKQSGGAKQAREALVTSVRLLEEAADHFESVGYRERAFDCFQVLIEVGRESGAFEDVLEGFVNCIRILREDNLKYFALQYLEDAIQAARERGELSAAATLAREAAEYARSLIMLSASAYYSIAQAELWQQVAKRHIELGAPPEIAENALLAAVLAFGELGQFAKVGTLYAELAELDLEEARKKHYLRAGARYTNLRDERIDAAPLPSHLRQDSGAPDVWHVDVVEWEQQGSAAEACADVVLDKHWPDLIRRKAMLARLTAFAVEGRPDDAPGIAARVRLADQLAQMQLYSVLAPLEHLYKSRAREVRLAVVGSLQTLFFKRTFATIRHALKDSDSTLVEQAARATEVLYFQHAFDPLSRIVRESNAPLVRGSALRALARVDTVEAAEFMLATLEHGAPQERTAAADALRKARGSRFVDLARSSLPSLPREVQVIVRGILADRGISV